MEGTIVNQQSAVALSHIGICTADLDQSLRFYTEALGFALERSIDAIGAPYDKLMELPGTTCRVHYLKCSGVMIELIGYLNTETVGLSERRPMNQLGFTHMTLIVGDIDAVAARVVKFGGRIHAETKIDSPFGPMLFCTDPNGVRIELMQMQATG